MLRTGSLSAFVHGVCCPVAVQRQLLDVNSDTWTRAPLQKYVWTLLFVCGRTACAQPVSGMCPDWLLPTVPSLTQATISHVPDDVLDAPPRPAAAAAAFANNGAAPAPYTLSVAGVAVDRLALPEDRARGDWEPRGKKKKSKGGKGKGKGADASDSCSGSVCGSQSETEEQQQQQQFVEQQQQQPQNEPCQAQPLSSLQQQPVADLSSLRQKLDSLGLQQQTEGHPQQPQQQMANGQDQPCDAAADDDGEGHAAAHPIAAVLA